MTGIALHARVCVLAIVGAMLVCVAYSGALQGPWCWCFGTQFGFKI